MATIIRGPVSREQFSGQTVRPLEFDLKDMSRRGEEYVQQVRDEAAKIVQQAHEEAKQIRKRAEEAGRSAAEGAIEQVLATRVATQIDKLRPAVDQMVGQLEAARGAWMDHWQTSAIELAGMIAQALIRKELTSQPTITESWIREALSLAAGQGEMTLRLNPQEFDHLAPRAEEMATSLGKIAHTKIVADASVTPGGCVVDTQYGSVDMRLESQVRRAVEEMT